MEKYNYNKDIEEFEQKNPDIKYIWNNKKYFLKKVK